MILGWQWVSHCPPRAPHPGPHPATSPLLRSHALLPHGCWSILQREQQKVGGSLLTLCATFRSQPNSAAAVWCGVLALNETSGGFRSAGRHRRWSSWPKRSTWTAWPSGRCFRKCSWLSFLQPTCFWRQLYTVTSHSPTLAGLIAEPSLFTSQVCR